MGFFGRKARVRFTVEVLSLFNCSLSRRVVAIRWVRGKQSGICRSTCLRGSSCDFNDRFSFTATLKGREKGWQRKELRLEVLDKSSDDSIIGEVVIDLTQYLSRTQTTAELPFTRQYSPSHPGNIPLLRICITVPQEIVTGAPEPLATPGAAPSVSSVGSAPFSASQSSQGPVFDHDPKIDTSDDPRSRSSHSHSQSTPRRGRRRRHSAESRSSGYARPRLGSSASSSVPPLPGYDGQSLASPVKHSKPRRGRQIESVTSFFSKPSLIDDALTLNPEWLSFPTHSTSVASVTAEPCVASGILPASGVSGSCDDELSASPVVLETSSATESLDSESDVGEVSPVALDGSPPVDREFDDESSLNLSLPSHQQSPAYNWLAKHSPGTQDEICPSPDPNSDDETGFSAEPQLVSTPPLITGDMGVDELFMDSPLQSAETSSKALHGVSPDSTAGPELMKLIRDREEAISELSQELTRLKRRELERALMVELIKRSPPTFEFDLPVIPVVLFKAMLNSNVFELDGVGSAGMPWGVIAFIHQTIDQAREDKEALGFWLISTLTLSTLTAIQLLVRVPTIPRIYQAQLIFRTLTMDCQNTVDSNYSCLADFDDDSPSIVFLPSAFETDDMMYLEKANFEACGRCMDLFAAIDFQEPPPPPEVHAVLALAVFYHHSKSLTTDILNTLINFYSDVLDGLITPSLVRGFDPFNPSVSQNPELNTLLAFYNSVIEHLRGNHVPDSLVICIIYRLLEVTGSLIGNLLLEYPHLLTMTTGLRIKLLVSCVEDWFVSSSLEGDCTSYLLRLRSIADCLNLSKRMLISDDAASDIYPGLSVGFVALMMKGYLRDSLDPIGCPREVLSVLERLASSNTNTEWTYKPIQLRPQFNLSRWQDVSPPQGLAKSLRFFDS